MTLIGLIGVIFFQVGKIEPVKERTMIAGSLRNIAILAKQGDTNRIESVIKSYEQESVVSPGYSAAMKLYDRTTQQPDSENTSP